MYPQYTPSKIKSKSIPVLAMRRRVGSVRNGVFCKDKVRGSRHFLRTPPGIALDVESLSAAHAAGAEAVQITDTESGLVYRATFEEIHTHGFRFNRGFGEQVGLEFRYWNTSKDSGDPQMETLPLPMGI